MIHILIASALASASLATPPAAMPGETMAVRTSDLDLSKPGDVARLQVRLRYAADAVCDNADDVFPQAAREIGTCQRDTHAAAEQIADAAITSARYRLASR